MGRLPTGGAIGMGVGGCRRAEATIGDGGLLDSVRNLRPRTARRRGPEGFETPRREGHGGEAMTTKAGDGIRTHDNHVGNVVLYQLSYTRDTHRTPNEGPRIVQHVVRRISTGMPTRHRSPPVRLATDARPKPVVEPRF